MWIDKQDEILYLESEGHYMEIVTELGRRRERLTLSDAILQLNQNLFAQVHRSYIVNVEKIESVERAEVVMISGDRIPVRRKYKRAMLSKMIWAKRTRQEKQ